MYPRTFNRDNLIFGVITQTGGKMRKPSKWHQLSFKINKELFQPIGDLAESQNMSVSAVCRSLFCLEYKNNSLNLGKHDRPFFRWVMVLAIIQTSFIIHLENQEKFFRNNKKKQVKADFFKYVLKVLRVQKFFYESIVMPKVAKQMDIILGDNESEKEANFIEDLCVLIDNSTADQQKEIKIMADKHRKTF